MKVLLYKQKSSLIGLLTLFMLCASYGQSPVITNPTVEKIWDGFNFVEGPLWVDTLGLLFSDIPENKVYRWSLDSNVSVYLTPSGNSNGLALDMQNKILLAQHGPRQVSRMEENGALTAIATHYDCLLYTSPSPRD